MALLAGKILRAADILAAVGPPNKFEGNTTIATTGTAGTGNLTGLASVFHDTARFSIAAGVVTVLAGGVGRYRVDGHWGFASNNAGTVRAGRVDGSVLGTMAGATCPFTNTSGFGATCADFNVVDLSSGETLTMIVRQDSGGNLSVTGRLVLTPVTAI